LSHCLWGGRFNPVIIVDNESFARHLIELFHVDALFPIGDAERCREFSKSIKHLPWPEYHGDLFEERGKTRESILLDLYHPVRQFHEEFVKDKSTPTHHITLHRWSDADPYAGVFEAMLGNYPDPSESSFKYRQFVSKYTAGKEEEIATGGALPVSIVRALTPNELTTFELKPELGAENYGSGFYVAEADSFAHLVEFWNLRAAGVNLLFFDPRFIERLDPVIEVFEQSVRTEPPHPKWGVKHLQLWLKSELHDAEHKRFKVPLLIREVTETTWDDRNWKGLKVNPPVMYFSENETVAQVSEAEQGPIVTLQFTGKPGYNEHPYSAQNLVATLTPTLHFSPDDRFVFKVPNIPELNEYFGRKHHINWDKTRAEKAGLGVITTLGTDHVTLWGMERFALAEKLFQQFGMVAELRKPGLVCEQLVRQMGGIQGCRVFKVKGVRKLIEEFKPVQSFERSAAMGLIRNVDPATGKADFTAYENLYIERRDSGCLKPDDVFSYLLKQGVFRVGIELECTSCKLEFWRALDEVKTLVTCDYCGREFNVAPQLKGEKWAFRPSGLFGRDDHQEGGVPVALTLQQLDTALHGEMIFWLPAMNLTPITAPIETCETDFVLLHQDFHGRVELVIGECKMNKEITEDDVRHLAKVADAFPPDRFDVFIVFAKAGKPFTTEEIERCRTANSNTRRRAIMLSARELEPYFVYELAEKEFHLSGHSGSLKGMAEATNDIYFEPRLKRK
jgi:hypothetical protein